MPDPSVTVIIPTHDHAGQLPYSIDSVLNQSHDDLALVIIGDGVGDDTRAVVRDAMRRDERISFVDRPKAPVHAEPARDEVIRSTDSPVIAYHGDDDLWLPEHLQTMVALLEDGADFAHPLPMLVQADGGLAHPPTDLARPECVDWHLQSDFHNAISLTGVAHTRACYERLPWGWRQTPPKRWTDHYMWQQFFGLEDLRPRTSPTATTVKFTPLGRKDWSDAQRVAEIAAWSHRLTEPDFASWWNDAVAGAVRRAAVDHHLMASRRQNRVRDLDDRVAELEHEAEAHELATGALKRLLDQTRAQRDSALATTEAIERSTIWRLTTPLRRLADATRHRIGRDQP